MDYGLTLAGIDWKATFQGIPAYATANALALAVSPITGSVPRVVNYGSYYEIEFTPAQEERLSAWILLQLNKEPGPVRVDVDGVALRVVTRKYWPYIAGAVGAGFVLGYAMKGRK